MINKKNNSLHWKPRQTLTNIDYQNKRQNCQFIERVTSGHPLNMPPLNPQTRKLFSKLPPLNLQTRKLFSKLRPLNPQKRKLFSKLPPLNPQTCKLFSK